MLRSMTRPLDHDVCGVMMRPGASHRGERGRQRLLPERVEDGATELAAAQRTEQGCLVDEAAAGHVDEPGTRLHLGQAAGIHELVGGGRERQGQDHEVSGRQQLRKLVMREDLVEALGDGLSDVEAPGITPCGDDPSPERDSQACHGPTDGAEPDDADRDLAQLARRQRLPGALALQLHELRQPPHDGQDHHHRVLGDGLAEDAAGVGDDEVASGRLGRQEALDPGGRGVHPGQSRAAGQEAIEARGRHRPAQQHLDIVERAVGEAFERDAHQSRAGGRRADAGQVLLAIAG